MVAGRFKSSNLFGGSMKKEILLDCHGPIAVSPKYESPWEDVWLTFKRRPNRVERLGPCLVSRANLEWELQGHREYFAEHPKADWLHETLAQEEAILARLREQPYVLEPLSRPGIPNIYTRAASIDRAEAERMLAWYLAEAYDIREPKFRWKRPRVVIIPCGG